MHWEVAKDWIGHGGADGEEVRVRAAALRHTMPCFGYVVEEADKKGFCDAEPAPNTAMQKCAAIQRRRTWQAERCHPPGGRCLQCPLGSLLVR